MGLRLILVSLAAALLIAAVSPLLYVSVASALATDSSGSFWWHAIMLPGISSALLGAMGLTGLAGFLIIEWNRGRGADRAGRTWDRVRVAASLSALSGAFFFGSGIVLGFVYVSEFRILVAIRVACWVSLSLSVGLFLFWTAERIDPPVKRLPLVALFLGGVAASVPATTIAASLLGLMPADSIVSGLLGLTASATGTLSLVIWIVVYGGILAKSGSTGRPSGVSG